jgi:hypothetical protein
VGPELFSGPRIALGETAFPGRSVYCRSAGVRTPPTTRRKVAGRLAISLPVRRTQAGSAGQIKAQSSAAACSIELGVIQHRRKMQSWTSPELRPGAVRVEDVFQDGRSVFPQCRLVSLLIYRLRPMSKLPTLHPFCDVHFEALRLQPSSCPPR